jgi:hypothetical protein
VQRRLPGVEHIIFITIFIALAWIPLRHHEVLAIIDYELELLTCAYYQDSFEASGLVIVCAWY